MMAPRYFAPRHWERQRHTLVILVSSVNRLAGSLASLDLISAVQSISLQSGFISHGKTLVTAQLVRDAQKTIARRLCSLQSERMLRDCLQRRYLKQ